MEQNPYMPYDPNYYLPPEHNPAYHRQERRNLCRIGWALASYLVFSNVIALTIYYVSAAFFPAVAEHEAFLLLQQLVPTYLLGFPFFALMLMGMPKKAPEKKKLGFSGWITFLAVSFFLMLAGSYIASGLMSVIETLRGTEITNAIDQQISESSPLTNLILIVIVAPIVEELMCRKLILDRLLPYSEVLAVLTSGLFFALLHGNLYQFFYAAFLGLLFSCVYVRTGNILHPILMHMIVNFTGSIIADFINTMTSDLASAPTSINPWDVVGGVYSMAMMVLAICGAVLLFRKAKELKLKKTGDRWLTLSTQFKLAWCNSGTITYCVLCLIMFVGSLYI